MLMSVKYPLDSTGTLIFIAMITFNDYLLSCLMNDIQPS